MRGGGHNTSLIATPPSSGTVQATDTLTSVGIAPLLLAKIAAAECKAYTTRHFLVQTRGVRKRFQKLG
jgi:hypothetical protein